MPVETVSREQDVRVTIARRPVPALATPSWYVPWKYAMDVPLALVLLVLTSPIVAVALVLVRLTSRGSAIYSQTRLGEKGRPYVIYKIRTMVEDCEATTGPRWASQDDPRVTPIGRFLRRTHLDELPQLWNVVRGDMSLVGPRPERPEFVETLEQAIPHYRDRMLVRPGLTGLAQIQLPADSDIASVKRKLACDLYYVQQMSLSLDLRIILSTLSYVMGLPFSIPRAIFRLPSGKIVERAYQRLAEAGASAGAHIQPA